MHVDMPDYPDISFSEIAPSCLGRQTINYVQNEHSTDSLTAA
jgi:hypothetical protein